MTFNEYKDQLLSYLRQEKELIEKDIQDHLDLSDDEKVEQGYLIKGCVVTDSKDGCLELSTINNNTKLRAGDSIELVDVVSGKSTKASVVENSFDSICVSTNTSLPLSSQYDIAVKEGFYLDPLIKVLEKLEEGASGTSYVNQLCGIEKPREEGFWPLDGERFIPQDHNLAQRQAVKKVLRCPSLYCIQGPPGTGKTNVLAAIASIFSKSGREVLIVSNTHQAVNNALNKIADGHLPVIKIGETLKAQQVSDRILKYKTFKAYKQTRKSRRVNTAGAIVGMTLHAAIINLGLCKSGFLPSVVLVDEASQIPLTIAAGIASFGAGSIVFIGDDRQMPPIFHPDLADDELSVSIFSHLTDLYPSFKTVLDTTYRMNAPICRHISDLFYKPVGITLKSDDSIADRHIDGEALEDAIENITINTDNCLDYNQLEAAKAAEVALKYKNLGQDVAIVTPFRKQVNAIYNEWKAIGQDPKDILVDTVERLQGQDVDVIILSFSVSDEKYYKDNLLFILNPQRLNVMMSRAKKKIIVIKSPIVRLDNTYAISPQGDVASTSGNASETKMFDIQGEPQIARDARKLILTEFKDLEFYEDGHKYLLHGKELHSVSGIGHRFIETPFDEQAQAKAYAEKHGATPDYWISQWHCNSFRATALGTKTHEFGESLGYLRAGHPEMIRDSLRSQYLAEYSYLAPIHPKEEAVELFMKELPSSYHLVLNEAKVYSGKNPDASKNLKEQICGTFDMLYWYDGDGDAAKAGFVILDYKTNKNLYNEYNRKYRRMLLPPFGNLYEEDYGLYVIQLNLYALMLEDIGLPVIARKIVWLKDDGTYDIIDTPCISDVLRECL